MHVCTTSIRVSHIQLFLVFKRVYIYENEIVGSFNLPWNCCYTHTRAHTHKIAHYYYIRLHQKVTSWNGGETGTKRRISKWLCSDADTHILQWRLNTRTRTHTEHSHIMRQNVSMMIIFSPSFKQRRKRKRVAAFQHACPPHHFHRIGYSMTTSRFLCFISLSIYILLDEYM